MPHATRMTRTAFVPIVVRHARRHGIDAGALLSAHGLPPCVENEPIAYVSTQTVRALAAEVADRLGQPDLGVRMALELARGSYGVLEFAVRSAPSLRDALDRFVRYQRMLNDLVDVRVVRAAGETEIVERFAGEPEGAGRYGNEFALAAIVAIAREITRHAFAVRRARLVHTQAPSEALVELLGAERIDVASGENALVIGDDVMDLPVTTADPSLLSVMDRVAPLIAPPAAAVEDIVTRVARAIASLLPEGAPSLAEVASRLASSTRSVQRELQARGTSFQRVLEDTRRKLVLQRLAETSLPLEAIAAQAGYSDVRPLARAFRRWMGRTPSEWRRLRLAGAIPDDDA